MKCATFNTNSVRARLPILQEWLQRELPDLLLLQETKVQDPDFPREPFEGLGYHTLCRGQKSYNGVAILSRHAPREVQRDLHAGGDQEARFLQARIQELRVIDVYVPQGYAVGSEKFTHKLHWLEALLVHLETQCRPEEEILLAGDFNVAMEDKDVYDAEGLRGQVCFHPEEQVRMQRILTWGFTDLLRKHHAEGPRFTFWDYRIPNALKRGMGWRIDYLLATRPLAERSRSVWIDTAARMLSRPSDHTFLVAEFQ